MFAVYVRQEPEKRLTISVNSDFGDQEIWVEFNTRTAGPSVRMNVSTVKYGKVYIESEDRVLQCSSGVLTIDFLKDIQMLVALYRLLVNSTGIISDKQILDLVKESNVLAGYTEIRDAS